MTKPATQAERLTRIEVLLEAAVHTRGAILVTIGGIAMDHELKLQSFSAVAAGVSAVMGFVAPWPHVIAGLFFATAGGFVGMTVCPSEERLALPFTMLAAIVIGIFAGLAHPHFVQGGAWICWISLLPVQLVMGVAGLASPWLARRAAAGDLSLPWKGRGERQ